MAQLSHPEQLFLDQRRARRHIGLYALPALLALVLCVWAGLFFVWPLAINPNAVLGAAETNQINCGSGALSRYALSATILVNVLFVLLSAMLVMRMAWARSERRYLKLLARFTEPKPSVPMRQ